MTNEEFFDELAQLIHRYRTGEEMSKGEKIVIDTLSKFIAPSLELLRVLRAPETKL
jgi:hypothetical protein